MLVRQLRTGPLSNEHQSLFSGSPFVRWAVTLLVLPIAVAMPLALNLSETIAARFIVAGIELLCLLLLVTFWAPPRHAHVAFRCACGFVFVAFATYLVAEFASGEPFSLAGRRSDASPRNALAGLITIGLPALWYAALGRFTLRPSSEPKSNQDEDE